MATALEKMDELAQQQEANGKEIQRQLTNMKKDSSSRKNEQYFDEKITTVKEIWKTIKETHQKIEELKCPEHNYFKQKYHLQLNTLYDDAIKSINEHRQKILSTVQEKERRDDAQQKIQKGGQILLKQFEELLNTTEEEMEIETHIDRRLQLQEKIKKKWEALSQIYIDLAIQDLQESIEQLYKHLETRHEKILLQLSSRQENESKLCNIRLPQIKLPIYDGRYEEWSTFRDIFVKVVHENPTISNTEKMQYLKTHLKGEASRLIQHLQITENNYTTCWELLSNRFNNERLTATNLINKILDFPAFQQESAYKLKQLHDTVTECLKALNNLKIDTLSWGPIIIVIICNKWDSETNRLYEQSLDEPNKIQNTDKLMRFLQTRFQSLEALGQNKKKAEQFSTKSTCKYCKESHSLQTCTKFQSIHPQARSKFVKDERICANCLNHASQIRCTSTYRCLKCKKFHHTLLHVDSSQHQTTNRNNQSSANGRYGQLQNQHARNQTTSHVGRQNEMVFLATAIIKIQNIYGGYEFLRVLVDPGSQSTFITEEAATLLSLPRERISAEVSGLGGENTQTAKWMIQATIKPRFSSSFEATVPCVVLPRLTRTLPNETLDVDVKQWKNDMLADPTFYRPGPIDLILGAKEYGDIVLNGIRKSSSGLLGQNTELGWILSGNISRRPKPDLKLLSLTTYIEEDEQLTKFWQLEEVNQKQPVSEEEEFCEKHYNDNTSRNEDGTYTVRIPFSNKINQLGASRSRAVARLLQLEKRFCREDNLKTAYRQFMQEYVNLGHMKISREDNTKNKYFIPHQPVIKESSTTTKLRVVFDASSKTSTGISLNQTMYNGPRLQQDLFDILLRWRSHKIVITADVEKMYRQIKIHQDDQKYQTILWRFNPTSPIQEYKLTTVTYGTTSAPYLAIKTIQRLAKDEENNFPKASEIAHRDFYVDDLLSGADSIREAQTLQHELINMFKSGGFTLRKWSSNCRELIESVDSEYRDQSIHEIDQNETRKSLGIHWAPYDDTFRFKTETNNSEKITKRIILSEVSKLFDPLGWLAPVIIKAKLLIQDLWLENLKWDDAVPEMIQTKWKSFQTELSNVESLIIPRWTHYIQGEEIEIHGFCDASEKAYGAVIYMKIKHNSNETKVTMLTAKSKVAPTKNKTTLPRLELCSALLLSRLMKKTLTALDITNVKLYAWTDSMITLSWIKGDITRWKTFVANRVSEINVMIPSQHWYHVKTKENPADVISRGLDPSKLKANENWWHGPAWLHSTTNLPFNSNIPTTDEEAKLCHTITIKHKAIDEEILKRFSSLTRLLRVTSYCQKFIDNCKSKIKNTNPLCVEELQKSMEKMVKIEQSIYFQEEIAALVEGKPLNKNSKLLNLNPFCDNLGILRVGGRLEKSQLSYNNKHPIILPYKGHLTRLITLHANTLHGGNQLTLSYTRKRYWIINGKKAVKFIIGKCIKCIRYKACTAKQLMGELPTARITPSYPFTHTGVDYAGPFHIKTTKGRGYKAYKGYIALFVCLATKAIHLEIVSDMSADTFLASFKRFISRRGHCSHMYSDNGTNFVGASKILHNEIKATINEANTQDQLVSIGTQWHFIPPSAPHFGGLWEAGVKSMKYHLRRIIGETRLTYEEMNTLIHQIEACLNSRPLCTLSDDPNEFSVLTPGHFLIGRPIIEPPDPIKTSVNSSLSERWKLIQKIKKEFWNCWTSDYLHQLQQRYKWQYKNVSLQTGDLVLIKEQDIHPSKWPLAKIVETHPATGSNEVRVVTLVKSDGHSLKRPIHKLIPLPMEPSKKSSENTKPTRRKKLNLWKVAITAILFLTILKKSTAMNYVIQYPQPGLYIEHSGHARIDRGTFRLELKFDKFKLNNDTVDVNTSIAQLAALCERAKELAQNTQCFSLIQHLKEKQKEIEWMNNGMNLVIANHRPKRGLVGNILISLFGVNDEIYMDISELDKNQKEIIRTSSHQTKFMLKAITTFNETEVRINNQLKRFHQKLNEGIEAINKMQAWFRSIDENKLNLHFLGAYQIVSNYIEEVTEYHRRILDVHYHRGQLFEFISPIHIEETISNISIKLPTNIKIVSYPVLRTEVQHSKYNIHISGYFMITEITDFILLKATPIPIKISKEAYWIFAVFNGLIAIDYNNQLYFQLAEEEISKCFTINPNSYICSPTTIRNVESSPDCVIDEIYQRSENTSCPIEKMAFQSTIWKQLRSPNTWMFITPNKLKIALICDGIREDIVLNQTGIINISSNCLIKTNKNILTPKRRESVTVLGTAIQPANMNIIKFISARETIKNLQTEPVLDASDALDDLVQEQTEIKNQIHETKFAKIHHHMIANSAITSILIVISILLTAALYYVHKIRHPVQREDPAMAGIPLEPIHLYSRVPPTEDPLPSSGQNV